MTKALVIDYSLISNLTFKLDNNFDILVNFQKQMSVLVPTDQIDVMTVINSHQRG